jgi:glycosyltransferase involved in cell wall biosynthesis
MYFDDTTIILCTFNRAPYPPSDQDRWKNPLTWSLESVLLQSDSCRIVIVDDGSTDQTQEYLQFIKRQIPSRPIEIIRNNYRLGLCSSRNIGIQSTKTRLILFADDDCYFRPGWLTGAAASYSWCADRDRQTAALTMPIYVRSFWPRGIIPRSMIGRLNASDELCTTYFDYFPAEYQAHPRFGPAQGRYLEPFLIERLSGVCLLERASLQRAGPFPEDHFWKNDYHEFLVVSSALNKLGLHIYHAPDPSLGAVHMKYGAAGRYPQGLDWSGRGDTQIDLMFCKCALGDLIEQSAEPKLGSGCRLNSEEFAFSEIGAFFGFLLGMNIEWAIRWVADSYQSYVVGGKSISEVASESTLSLIEREQNWDAALNAGISYAQTKGLSLPRRVILDRTAHELRSRRIC